MGFVEFADAFGEYVKYDELVRNFGFMGLAYALSFPLGFDREESAPGAGLRTFPLVGLAACGFMLNAMEIFDDDLARSRIIYGIITGLGFIGGGAILKNGTTVVGTATAASLWNTGAIGVAVATREFEIAMILSLVNFVTLRYIKRLVHSDISDKEKAMQEYAGKRPLDKKRDEEKRKDKDEDEDEDR